MRTYLLLTIFATTMACLLCAMPAHAQATRTWVSGVGDDANPCSRTAPCKTFAGAFAKTATAGEINCLDPGGFGAVTITKSIAIDCEAGTAGVLVSGTNGIVVNVAATDTVALRGLDFEGLTTGLSGILFVGGGTLHVDKCIIRLFNSSSAGFGINFTPNDTASLVIQDSTLASNGGTSGAGLAIAPTGGTTTTAMLDNVKIVSNFGGVLVKPAGVAVNLSITRSHIDKGTAGGLRIDGTGGGPITTAISDSSISFNGANGMNVIAGASLNIVNIRNSVLAENGQEGVQVNGGSAGVQLSTTLLDQNVAGATLVVNGGNIFTYGNNEIVGPPGSGFTQAAALQ